MNKIKERIYLATPYTHPSELVRKHRFETVSKVAGIMTNEGKIIYSPISHGHTLASFENLPAEFDFWQEQCLSFLHHWADEVHVLMLDGWKESKGVQAEIEEAKKLGLEIKYINCDTLGELHVIQPHR